MKRFFTSNDVATVLNDIDSDSRFTLAFEIARMDWYGSAVSCLVDIGWTNYYEENRYLIFNSVPVGDVLEAIDYVSDYPVELDAEKCSIIFSEELSEIEKDENWENERAEARDTAICFQSDPEKWMDEHDMGYIETYNYFSDLGELYNLTEEFEENAII